jgi:hypothetical protein
MNKEYLCLQQYLVHSNHIEKGMLVVSFVETYNLLASGENAQLQINFAGGQVGSGSIVTGLLNNPEQRSKS